MSWVESDISNDTIYQEGTFGYLFTASGTVYRGQAVKLIDNNYVTNTTTGSDGIGICDAKTLHGNECVIYLPGNIVKACGTEAYKPSTMLYASGQGFLCSTRYSTERPMAIVVSEFEQSTTNYVGEVLLI